MESRIAKAIHLSSSPVALSWSDQKPEGAMQFSEGKWGCVMWLAASAAKGKTAAADRKTFGCVGGGVGIGFGNQYLHFPGGEEGFCHFLLRETPFAPAARSWRKHQAVHDRESHENFLNGERYIQIPRASENLSMPCR
jgi:hypothetical protein